MTKSLLLAVTVLFSVAGMAQTVLPLLQPRETFVDSSGDPCAGCSLYSYAAGTNTPQPTYTDASGSVQNPNPVVLDASGSASIWVGTSSYKFVLIDTFGTTLWTVDQVLAPLSGSVSLPYLPLAGGTMSGNINMGGNNIVNVGQIGIGTSSPGWPIDVENGPINSSGGYLYNGAAGSAGQCLVSNGTAFIPGTCFSPGSTFYQTMQSNTSPEPQEPALNFSVQFALTDNSGVATNLDLAPSGITGGTYTNPTVTFDNYGRATSASNGASIPVIQTLKITSGICTTSGAETYCSLSPVSWSSPFADTGYSVTCSYAAPPSGTGSNPGLYGPYITVKTTSSITIELQAGSASAAGNNTVGEIDCIGVHP